MFFGIFGPALLKPVVLNIVYFNPTRLPNDRAKDVVLMAAFLPVENAGFFSTTNTSGKDLVNIDMFHPIVILVVVDRKIDGRYLDSLSSEPAYSLKAQNLICIVAEGLVLW